MKRIRGGVFVGWVLLFSQAAGASGEKPGAESARQPGSATLATDDDKTFYALGRMLGQRLASLRLAPAEVEKILLGFEDAAAGRPERAPVQTYGPKIDALLRGKAAADAEKRKARDATFMEAAAKEKGAVQTPSGLVFLTLEEGTGLTPGPSSIVKVQYEGKLTDGTLFDGSGERAQPSEFHVDQVVPCWTEGLQRMKVGGKARLVCPSSIAYGDHGRPPAIPPAATLVFEVALLEVRDAPPAGHP